MRILVTNDDGYAAEGLRVLAEAMEEIGEVVVVAPEREKSATGRALTLGHPLRLRAHRENWYSVDDGTPTDCVNMAFHSVMAERPPDLIVSGINRGSNLGDDVTYSGTVGAAFEATMHFLPALAFSQQIVSGRDYSEDVSRSAGQAGEIVRGLIGEDGSMLPNLLLNVNFPAVPSQGLRWTRLGKRFYEQSIVKRQDPSNKTYYWISGTPRWESSEGTDHAAVVAGYTAVTPLHLDLTDDEALDAETPARQHLRHLESSGLPG